MYSRKRDTRIPYNYSGNAFVQREAPVRATPSKIAQIRSAADTDTVQEEEIYTPPCVDDVCDSCPLTEEKQGGLPLEICHKNDKKDPLQKPFSILSPIGNLGTEELLLIALALIIFQSKSEPELALILLALLFIN